MCPKSLCVIYEENAIVKYPGRVYVDLRQACLIISMSFLIHRSCIDMCGLGAAQHTLGTNEGFKCLYSYTLTVVAFDVFSL